MVTLIFAVAAVVCGLGWLNQTVVNRAVLSWILDKGLELPGPEMKEHLIYAWTKTLGIK